MDQLFKKLTENSDALEYTSPLETVLKSIFIQKYQLILTF